MSKCRAFVLVSFGLVIALASTPPLLAQQPARADDGRVGKRVVPKYREFRLRVGERVIDPRAIEIYRVDRVNGPWLRLKADGQGLGGWSLADQVVPVEQAIDFFTDYIRANPGDPHGYTMRAVIWCKERRELDKAIADHTEAVRLAPTEAWVYINRGLAWDARREYDKAIADHTEAVRLDPRYAAAYYNRGTAWYARREYDKAIADYNEVIRLDPEYAYAYNGRAWIWATCPDAEHRDGKKGPTIAPVSNSTGTRSPTGRRPAEAAPPADMAGAPFDR
jgi:tetratricopeptide (TPR) repeat protein